MYKLKNIVRLAGSLMIMILLVVSFFNLTRVRNAEAVTAFCGPYANGIGSCLSGSYKPGTSRDPLVYNWQCETTTGSVNCSSIKGSSGTTAPTTPSPVTPPAPANPPTPTGVGVTLPNVGTGVFVPIKNPPTTTATDPTAPQCATPFTSNWANINFTVPCCGAISGSWISWEEANYYLDGGKRAAPLVNLCSGASNGNKGAKDLKMRPDENEPIMLSWTCGVQLDCRAYIIPKCSDKVSQYSIEKTDDPNDLDGVSPNNAGNDSKMYEDKEAYDKAIDAKNFCKAGDYEKLDPFYSILANPNDVRNLTKSFWYGKNAAFVCANARPASDGGDIKRVRCVAGWSEQAKCGKAGLKVKPVDDRYEELMDLLSHGKSVNGKFVALSQDERDTVLAELAAYDGKEYKGTDEKDTNGNITKSCKEDADVSRFFNLDSDQELCPPGSKAINKTYKRNGSTIAGDTLPDRAQELLESPYEGLGSSGRTIDLSGGNGYYETVHVNPKKSFDWQCVVDDGRNGKPVDCQAVLKMDCAVDKLAECGPAEDQSFAYTGSGPTKDFCSFGYLLHKDNADVFGSPEYDVSLDLSSGTPIWNWSCRADQKNPDGSLNTDTCSASPSVYCGAADGGQYDSENAIRNVGACAGIRGSLVTTKNGEIYKDGSYWKWTCADSADAKVKVECRATNTKNDTKCGYADGKSYLPATIQSGNNDAPGFLCQNNNSLKKSPTILNNSSVIPGVWTWNCGGETDCQATALECGHGNMGKYMEKEMQDNKDNDPAFLCSNGRLAVRSFNYTNNYDLNDATYDPTWFWSCEGDKLSATNNTRESAMYCSAGEYKCGYFDRYSVKKSYLADFNTASKKDYFCTYGATATNFYGTEDSSAYTGWDCLNNNDSSPYSLRCSARHPNCGAAVSSRKAYSKAKLESYFPVNLRKLNPLEQSPYTYSFLCNVATTEHFPGDVPEAIIKDDGEYWSWTCGGSDGFVDDFAINKNLDNVQQCRVPKGQDQNCNDSADCAKWADFYSDVFNMDYTSVVNNLCNDVTKPNSDGKLKFLQYMVAGLDYKKVHDAEIAWYGKKDNGEDRIFDEPADWTSKINPNAEERKVTNGSYAIYHSGAFEADEAYAGSSANYIASKKIKTMTRLETAIFRLYIYWNCKDFKADPGASTPYIIDRLYNTYSTGSRTYDNKVPNSYWNSSTGELNSRFLNPDQGANIWRPRLVISL